ncbi:hypothetical protein [Prevotella sp.]
MEWRRAFPSFDLFDSCKQGTASQHTNQPPTAKQIPIPWGTPPPSEGLSGALSRPFPFE